MSVFLFFVAVLVFLYVAFYYGLFKAAKCQSSVELKGKTAIVTGSNCGIGKSTALDLARRGARVILACRDQYRAEAAVYDIRTGTGNNQVVFMELDLASLESVRRFTETFLRTEPRLDILINNAGVLGSGRTKDGFGLALGVNHLGHFLLTTLLLERLQRCAPSRVVTVASGLHRFGNIDFPLLDSQKDLVSGQSMYRSFKAYCSSKLCNVLFTRELSNRLEGTSVSCFCLHPGVVGTSLFRNLGLQLLFIPYAKLFLLDPDMGSQTTLHCALQEGIEPLSGRYFANCLLKKPSTSGQDDALAQKLWEVSERLTGTA